MLLNGLAARGRAVTLFLFAREGVYFDQLRPDVRVVIGSRGRLGRLTSLRRFLRREPQHIVVSFLSHFTGYVAVRAATRHTKYVISQQTPLSAFLEDHDYPWRRPLQRGVFTAVARSVYPRVDAVAAASHGVADDLVGAFGVSPNRVAVVPNPVDLDAVEHSACEPIDAALTAADVPVIVTAGRLAHAKNLPLLVAALERLARSCDFRAWILGRGELESELRALLARATVGDRVSLLGFQSNPWKFMARGDVFLLTSRYEGFGNVLIEAMACGLPVVATASSGTRDIVEHERSGLLVERHDADSVASALERLLRDAAGRAEMADAARQRARSFGIPAVVDRFDTLLEQIAPR
jgi:glycosyltransferase involved in cell wall biosynthesis